MQQTPADVAFLKHTRLFSTDTGERFFGGRRYHIHIFGNLILANFRVPSGDYADLLKVTTLLTRSHVDLERAFRLMCFNVIASNRDDHTMTLCGEGKSPNRTHCLKLAEQSRINRQRAEEIF